MVLERGSKGWRTEEEGTDIGLTFSCTCGWVSAPAQLHNWLWALDRVTAPAVLVYYQHSDSLEALGCVYMPVCLRLSWYHGALVPVPMVQSCSPAYTVIAELPAIVCLKCTEADGGFRGFFGRAPPPLRGMLKVPRKTTDFVGSQEAFSLWDLLTCREDPSPLMMHQLQ